MQEAKKLFVQFATVLGFWVIAHHVWRKYVRGGGAHRKFANAKCQGSSSAQFRYNSYQL